MGSLTWTLLPLTLLGGVPLPLSSYTIYIQRELHRLCKPASSWLCPKDMISLCDRLEFTKLFSSWTAVASASAVKEQQDNVVEMLEERMNKVQGQVDPWTSPLATVLRQKRDVPHSEKKGGNKSSPSASYSSQDTPTSKRGSRTTTAEENAVKRMSLTNSPDVKSFRNATAVSLDSKFGQELTSHAPTHNFYFERLATAGKIKYQNGIPGNEFETAVLEQDITNKIADSTSSTATKTSDPSTQASNNTDFDGIAADTYQYSSEPTDVSASRRWNPGETPAELTTSREALFFTINESVFFRRARNADSDVSDDQAKTINTMQLVSNYSTSTEHDSSLTSAAYITDSASESFTHKNDHVTATPELLDEPVIPTTQDLPVGTASPVNTVKPEEFTQTTLDEKSQVQTSAVPDVLSSTHRKYQSTVSLTGAETVQITTNPGLTSGSVELTYAALSNAVEPFTLSPKDGVTVLNATYESSALPTVGLTVDVITDSQPALEPGNSSQIPVQQTPESGQPITSSPGDVHTYTQTIQKQPTSPALEGTAEMTAGTKRAAAATSSIMPEERMSSEAPQYTTQANNHETEPPKTNPEAWTPSEQPDHKMEGAFNTQDSRTSAVTLSVHGLQQRTTAGLDRTDDTTVVSLITPNPASGLNTLVDDNSSHAKATQNPLPTTTSQDDVRDRFETKPPFVDTTEEPTAPVSLLPTSTSDAEHATDTVANVSPVDAENSSNSGQTSTPLPTSALNPEEEQMGTGRKKPEVSPTVQSPEAYPSVNSVRVRLGLDARYNSCVRGREWQFREHIRRQLSVLLRVPLPGIRNVRVRPGSILVDADMVPVKTPTLELDKPALLAARRDLQERIDRGAVVVVDLDGNRLPIFTSTVYSLQPPHGTSYSPALLGALTAMFLAAASVIVASACLAKRHIGERHVSPSPEREADLEQPVEPQFLRLVSPSLLISTRLEDPASVTILRDTRMLPRRSLVPEPPVYKPARDDGDAPPVPPPPPVPRDEPSERLSAETWQSLPFDSPVAPSDSFSLEPWSTTPYQSRSEAESGSDVTSRWTATPSGRWTSRSESFSEKTSARVPFSEKRVQNGHVK